MKIKLELVINDEAIFLNYWDWQHGEEDVCAEIKGGKIYIDDAEVSLQNFIDAVKQAAKPLF